MSESLTKEIDDYYSNRDVWILSSSISRDLYVNISNVLESKQDKKLKCTLFLTTYGGDPDAAFRIARAFKHYYPEANSFKIVICGYCKSAGTLIAIGADELAVGNMGELGPLDVQVFKSDEFIDRISGLEIEESLDVLYKHAHRVFKECLLDIKMTTRVSMKIAGEFASSLATGLVAPLYAQIDPNRIGELTRAMKIAKQYGQQLNEKTKNLKDPASLDQIISGYPSHSFVIDRKEAGKLFNKVYDLQAIESLIFQNLKYNGLIYQLQNPIFVELKQSTIIDIIKTQYQLNEDIKENEDRVNEHSGLEHSKSRTGEGTGKVPEEKSNGARKRSKDIG